MHSRRWKWYVNMWGVSSVVVGLPPLARRHAMINAVAMLSNGNVNSLSRAIEPLVNKRRRRCRFPRLPRPHHPPPPDKTATIANAADQGDKWLMTNVFSSFRLPPPQVNHCSDNTPCGWAVYTRFTRVVDYFMKNTCTCETGLECIRVDDDVSVSAYVYKCRQVPNRSSSSNNGGGGDDGAKSW